MVLSVHNLSKKNGESAHAFYARKLQALMGSPFGRYRYSSLFQIFIYPSYLDFTDISEISVHILTKILVKRKLIKIL